MNNNDVIAAISTNSSEAAISIVRMSGSTSDKILKKIFKTKNTVHDRMMSYGHIVDPISGEVLDEVMAVFLSAPKTYTRENVVEIYCHGGSVSANRILELLVNNGARLAERGEFTFRAFMNGRIDLTQAESVADLISAKTKRAFTCALKQLEGSTSGRVNEIIEKLMDLLASITVSIDYPEEDIEEVSWTLIREEISGSISMIDQLLKNAEHSRLIKDGVKVAIIGKPNVGKSSLMNLLLGSSRAIVTDIPGTTRDTIEETISLDGYPLRIIDTAGIRETDDQVEKMGVERSKMAANDADIVLFLLDAGKKPDQDDREMYTCLEGREIITILNKCDLCSTWNKDDFSDFKMCRFLSVSILNHPQKALDEILSAMKEVLKKGITSDDEYINIRHQKILRDVRTILLSTTENKEYDLVEIDLRESIALLGKITGRNTDADLLNIIFSKFCLGK